MSELDMKSFNEKIIEEFRANNGKVAMFNDYPMVILHTLGAKSGRPHLVPLVLTINEKDEWLLFATFAGSPTNPAWVYNLRANPQINIEYGRETFAANVIELEESAAQAIVNEHTSHSLQFAGYVTSAAPRRIPVFRIDRL